MKITLDIDKLLYEKKITQRDYEHLKELAAKSTSSLAFNLLIGFGVIAVSGAALALVPSAATAIVIGLCVLISGLVLLFNKVEHWKVLANICILVGALMLGGGIISVAEGSLLSILSVSAIYAAAALFAKSSLLAVLATLVLSSSIGVATGYSHASYFLMIKDPSLNIIIFSLLAVALYQLSKRLSPEYERISIASARTSVFLVNLAFWVGSLWGERFGSTKVFDESFFSIVWAIALLSVAIWSWKQNLRWLLNTLAVFGGIHFYTQWFETLGASPGTVLFAGVLALGFAVGLRKLNSEMVPEKRDANL